MTKLMLVEDDNNLREIYEARLQAEGYTIVSARDGEEALVIAKAEKPDLIISDIMMPKISGFEMLDILRNTPGLQDVKVIMLTALGQSDDQQRADRLGADRYLVKSQVTLEDIVKVARELLADTGAPAAQAPADDTNAQSTAQEEADVEAKIEDFVTGASEEATNPDGSTPTPTPEPTPEPEPAPAPEAAPQAPGQSDADNKATDDKLVADAVDTLVSSTEEDAESEAEDDDDLPSRKKVGGERVIEPIETEPQKDIHALLAVEEAKEAQSQAGSGPTAIVVNDKSGPEEPRPQNPGTPASLPNPGDKVDPNSIAL